MEWVAVSVVVASFPGSPAPEREHSRRILVSVRGSLGTGLISWESTGASYFPHRLTTVTRPAAVTQI